ncbi:hypothetical protein [Arthrobacter sp. C152]
MRWDALFNDVESQFAEADRLALDAEINDRTRAELVNFPLEDRLRAALGYRIGVYLGCGESVQGEVAHVGADALLLNDEHHQQVLVPFASASRYVGLGRHVRAEASTVRRAIGLAHSLRCLARDRADVSVMLGGGAGERLSGVIDRVGKDYLDLATVSPGEARRGRNVGQVSTIPFTSLAMVRSQRQGEL